MATTDQVQQLYITYFGRPADPSGLAYWTADEATPLSVIAQGFATTPEFAADTEGRTLDQIVNSFYVDLFGRNAEPAGLAFWVQQIQIGNTTIEQAGLEIGNAALTPEARGNADNVALLAKIAASDQWTALVASETPATLAYSGTIGIDAGVNYLLPVLNPATIPTEEQTQAQIDVLVQANSSGGGTTLELSIFADIATDTGTVRLDNNASIQETSPFRFSAGNQTVNGTATTFSGVTDFADRLVDGFTTDEDVLNVTGLASGNAAMGVSADGTAATVTNIENINYVFANATGAAGVAANITGAKAFNFAGTIADGGNVSLTIANSGATSFTSMLTGDNASRFDLTTGDLAETITLCDLADDIVSAGGNDTILAEGGNDTINAGTGDDSVSAGTGDDIITLGAGNDTVDSGTGADQITDAGVGNDTILHSAPASTVAAAVTGTGIVTVTATEAGFTSTSAAVNTTVNASTSTASVTLTGDAGADTLSGGSSSDTIDGGAENDVLVGNAGNDTINGGTGNDTITGGTGADRLDGKNGDDQFNYAQGATGITLATADTIVEFETTKDKVSTGIAGFDNTTDVLEADGTALASFAEFVAAADAAFLAGDDVFVAWNAIGSGNAYVAINNNGGNTFTLGDSLIVMNGIDTAAKIAEADFIV